VVDAVTGVVLVRVIPFSRYSAGDSLLTLAVTFAWFEIWFYATHRLLHTRRLYFLHAQHHVAHVTDPLTSLSFGLIERSILGLGSLAGGWVFAHCMPFTYAGMGMYFSLNYALNVWGHLNVEMVPTRFREGWLGKVFITTTFHAMHHARYGGHYGLFTVLLDRSLGTAWDDYPAVHARAFNGHGLASLGERVRPSPGTGTLRALRQPVQSTP
jgi:sterol desaturase/sphingolipid hydroxylase (fatty acid hydroxylase superfamily)